MSRGRKLAQGYSKVFLLSTLHGASRRAVCSAKRLLNSPVVITLFFVFYSHGVTCSSFVNTFEK
jgi:hypothetical protein